MKKIGDLFTQSSGKALKKSNQIGTLHKYITTSNLFWGRFDFSEVREMFFQDSELEKCTARNGDLLVCNGGDVGRAAVWNYDYDICLQNHITRLRKKSENVNPCYYQHFFRYIKTNNLINGNGVGIESLSSKEILNMSVPYPSIEEQNRIVDIFDRIQFAIDNKKQQLSLLDEAVKSEFVEMFSDLDCKIKTIEQTCTMKSGTTFSKNEENDSGEIFYIKVSGMNLPENDKYIKTSLSFVSRKVAGKTIIPANSIIFPKRGGAIGTNKKRITEQEICIDLNTMAVTPSNELNIQYLYQYFQNLDMGKLYNGSTVPQINNKDIGPLKIKVPPLELQQQFAAFVEQIDKSKFVL